MLFIDANIFLAHDNIRDVHHQRALNLWKNIESGDYGECFTSDYVFNEVVGVTLRKHGKERAIQLGNQLLQSMFMLNIDDHLLRKAWQMFTTLSPKFNFVDCTHFVAMELAASTTIASFDKEFQKAQGITVVF